MGVSFFSMAPVTAGCAIPQYKDFIDSFHGGFRKVTWCRLWLTGCILSSCKPLYRGPGHSRYINPSLSKRITVNSLKNTRTHIFISMKLDSLSILVTPSFQCVVYIIMHVNKIKLGCYVLVLAMLRMPLLMTAAKSVIPLCLLELWPFQK